MAERQRIFCEKKDVGDNLAEGFLEQLDRLADGFRCLEYRWENRLAFEDLSIVKDYVSGRAAILLYFSTSNSENLQVVAYKAASRKIKSGLIGSYHQSMGFSEGDRRHEKIMLVDLVDFIDEPNGIVPSSVGIYVINDEGINLWEGSLYWSVLNGVFKVCPRFVKRELVDAASFSVGVSRVLPDKGHPAKVQSGTKIVRSVSESEGDTAVDRDGLIVYKALKAGFVRLKPNGVEVRFAELPDSTLKLIDVAVGPFDL